MESTGGLETEPTKFIQSAFLGFDATLTTEDVIKELKTLAGKEDDLDEDDEGGVQCTFICGYTLG